jgi:hydroxylysine kinase
MTRPDPAGSLLSLPPPELEPSALARLARDHWGVAGQMTRLTSERDLNHRIDTAKGSFTLKLANPAEPARMTKFQTAALDHVATRDPGLPVPRIIPALDGRRIIPLPEGALRLLSWCPGTPVARLPHSPALAAAIGSALARLTAALADFDHPGADHRLLWDIKRFEELAPLFPALPPDQRSDAESFHAHFAARVAPRLAALPMQVVHADFNLHNLVADAHDPTRLTGILDFGDMVRTPRVCDLAVACSYVVAPADPLALILPLVAAYARHLPLAAAEIAVLPDLILARMLTSLTISSWRSARYPGNAEYILRNAPSARLGLQAIRSIPPARLAHALAAACEGPAP